MTNPNLLPGATTPQQQQDDEDISFLELWALLRRNRLIIGSAFLVLATAGTVYAFRAAPVYEASVKIRIDERQSNLPVLDVLKTLSSGSEVNTEMEVLQSRTIAEDVVDSLGLRVTLEKPARVLRRDVIAWVRVPRDDSAYTIHLVRDSAGRFMASDASTRQQLETIVPGIPAHLGDMTLELAPSAAQHEEIDLRVAPFRRAVGAFQQRVSVSRPNRQADIVVVRYQGMDRAITQQVPDLISSYFMRRRLENKKVEARSTVGFLRGQLDTLTRQLRSAEDSLQRFREGARVVSLESEASAQVKQLVDLQAERGQVEAERVALAALLDTVKLMAAKQRPGDPSPYRRLLAFPTLLRNNSTSAFIQALNTVENDRAALLVRRLPQDPDVQLLTDRVHEIEGQVRAVAESYLQGLTSQVASLDAALRNFGGQLEKIPSREVEFARLQRQPKLLEELYTALQMRLKEAQIAEAVEDPSVRVVDASVMPLDPIKPKKPLIVLVSGLAGLMLGVMAAFLRESRDHAVRTREQLQQITSAPVLGIIPRIKMLSALAAAGQEVRALGSRLTPRRAMPRTVPAKANSAGEAAKRRLMLRKRLITSNDPRHPISEAYRTLRTNITFARPDKRVKTIVFTSPAPGDGKTTSAANLAITLAQQGLRVLLIDADMRRGMLNAIFDAPRVPGLSEALFGITDVASSITALQVGESGKLSFLATGTLPPNPAELLGSARMRELLEMLGRSYDAILLDAPPLNVVTDAAVLGTVVDGVIVVARAGETNARGLAHAVEQLRNVRASLLGTIFNDVDFKKEAGYYGSYGYYYDYGAYIADAPEG